MRTRRHSEDVASESYTARVDDANGTITREKKHLTQICVHKIGGSTDLKERCRAQDISINAAYKELRGLNSIVTSRRRQI